jgi:hypothetical protein
MPWIVEYLSSAFSPPRWSPVPTPSTFPSEQEAQVRMVMWIFEAPSHKFRVRKEG